jgi:hypothetical protein
MQLVQFPVDIEMSGGCDARSAASLLPIILAMLVWAQPHDGEGTPFVEISCTSDGSRIVIAPDRTVCRSDFVGMPAQSPSSPDWLRAIASALAHGGHSFVVRSNGQLATFALHQGSAGADFVR